MLTGTTRFVTVLTLAALLFLALPAHAAPAIDAEEQQFLTLLNQYRASHGAGALALDSRLNAAADWLSTDMGVNAYFSHIDSLGRDPWTRVCVFSYCTTAYLGESTAEGFSSAQAVFDAWRETPDDNQIMLDPLYQAVGIGRAVVPGSPFTVYWTADFSGEPVCRQFDLNNDKIINGSDLLQFAPFIGSFAPGPPYSVLYDLNNDGRVNGSDLLRYAPFVGKKCP